MPEITIEQAQALYDDSDAAHAFDHVLRVTRLAEHIAEMEGADVQIVRTAGLLHDCARLEPDHHLAGARRARTLLAGKDPAFVDAVAHCIEAHRFSTEPHPATLEAQCLCDADKLDAIGAVGVARAFAFAGHHNNRLWSAPLSELQVEIGEDRRGYRQRFGGSAGYTPGHELICKLAQLAEGLYTASARRIAAERHAFMVSFFERLDAEALGEV
ncbi:MAG: HD domain-containing protein [Caldilineales bacterium]|nr:HD domain-containing protein [Caldilineales bacterium]